MCYDLTAAQGPNCLTCPSQEPATMLPSFHWFLGSCQWWDTVFSHLRAHLVQKGRGVSHGPQPSAHSLGALYQAEGLVIQERLWRRCWAEGSCCEGAGTTQWQASHHSGSKTPARRPRGWLVLGGGALGKVLVGEGLSVFKWCVGLGR